MRGAKAVAQTKQGQWLNWESFGKKKISWRHLWDTEERPVEYGGQTCGIWRRDLWNMEERPVEYGEETCGMWGRLVEYGGETCGV